jgi:3'(2'), 5'-bisphosphate nucleotidase
MNTQELIHALIPVVREAGAKIMVVYAQGGGADFKADGSPVTEADQAAEAVILAALARLAPHIPVISEENAASHALAAPERFFLVDPLDGTKEFLKRDGQGAFTVNIGLIDGGVPVAGLVYAPALDRLFCGVVGQGAREVSAGTERAMVVRELPLAGPVAVASVSHRDDQTNAWLAAHGIEHTVSIGSSLKFCLLAAGEADVYPRFGPTMEWDTAAGDAVLRAAGGAVTTPEGTPFGYGKADYRNGAFVAWGAASLLCRTTSAP